MSLEVEQRKTEGIIIFDLNDPLTMGHGDGELRDRIAALRECNEAWSNGVASFFPDRALKGFDRLDFVQHEEPGVLHHELLAEAAC